jgi:hypothetical protein
MIRPLDILRLLLGAVLVITAMRYFMPFLIGPYVPLYEWSDPMAVRLMAGFDQSGLGAVARFIHVIAGLLLLTNRATPFALAAAMPVNLCGLFISLFIEGSPVIAILAIALVALNALLMLAHLSAYRGVLKGGALADGEGAEPGQNFVSLFSNPLSGTPTKAYLLAAIPMLSALYVFWRVVPFANGTMGLYTLIVPVTLFLAGLVLSLVRKDKV